MTSMIPKCPTCRLEVLPRAKNPVFPFCSDRCKAIDLGKWLGGEYRIAAASKDEDEDGETPPLTDA